MDAVAAAYIPGDEMERKIRAYYDDMLMIDPLTLIPNRRGFYAITNLFIHERLDTEFVICSINFDKFKLVNDLFGTKVGDELLIFMADHLRDFVGEGGTFARLTADNFAICIPDEEKIYKKITAMLKAWFEDYPISLNIVTRCGFYHIHDRDVEVGLMCDRANLAIQEIKGSYDRDYAVYDDKIRNRILQEQEIINEMKSALDREQFTVYYQPKFNMETGKLIGSEALVRWIHPEKGMISPGLFVPIFEKNGFISALDKYVWEKVCSDVKQWIEEGLTVCPVSINVSRAELYNKKLSEYLVTMVDRYGIPLEYIQLEITESAYTDDPDQIIKMVQELKTKGFIILMDDFGSGYSSLNTLKDVPVDVLKLDLKFLYNMDHNRKANYILKSVVDMAKRLDLVVIAEGVETETQAEFLKSIGCIRAQGYLYAKPMPRNDLEFFLSDPDRVSQTDEDTRAGIVNIDDVLAGFHREDELEWYRAAVIQLKAKLYEYDIENDILQLYDMQVGESRELSRVEVSSFLKSLDSQHFMYDMDAGRIRNMIEQRVCDTFDLRASSVMGVSGGFRWFRHSGRVLTTSDGTPKSMVGVLRNISDEKAEEALLEVMEAFENESDDRILLEKVLGSITYGLAAHSTGMLFTRSRKSTDLGGVAVDREHNREVVFDEELMGRLDSELRRLEGNSFGICVLNDQDYDSYSEGLQEFFFSHGEKVVATYMRDISNSMTLVLYCTYKSNGKIFLPEDMRHLGEVFKSTANSFDRMYSDRYEKENLAMYSHAFTYSNARLWEWDVNSHVLHRSPSAIDDDGMGEWVDNVPEIYLEAGLIHPDFEQDYIDAYRALSEGMDATVMVKKLQKDGTYIWHHIGYSVILDSNGDPVKAVGIGEDVNQLYHKQMEVRERIMRRRRGDEITRGWFKVDLDDDVILEANGNMLIVRAGESFSHMVGRMCEERVLPEYRQIFLDHNLPEKLYEAYKYGNRCLSTTYRYLDEKYKVARRALNIDLSKGDNGHVFAFIRHRRLDSCEENERYVLNTVQWDNNLGLYGVESFGDMVRHLVEKEKNDRGVLFIIDIDKSSLIKDALGSKYADEVLLNIVAIVKAILPDDIIFGRMLSDRFAAYMPKIEDEIECLRIYRDIQKNVFNAFSIGKKNYILSCSIGMCYAKDCEGSYDKLLGVALEKMYNAKMTD